MYIITKICNINKDSIQSSALDLIMYIATKICKPIKWFDINVTTLICIMNYTFVYIPML